MEREIKEILPSKLKPQKKSFIVDKIKMYNVNPSCLHQKGIGFQFRDVQVAACMLMVPIFNNLFYTIWFFIMLVNFDSYLLSV